MEKWSSGAVVDAAKSWVKEGQYNEALSAVEEALTTYAADPELLECKGDILLKLGKPKEALQSYSAIPRKNYIVPMIVLIAGSPICWLFGSIIFDWVKAYENWTRGNPIASGLSAALSFVSLILELLAIASVIGSIVFVFILIRLIVKKRRATKLVSYIS